VSPDSWQVNVEQQWQLSSSSDDVFATEHAVRQHFFQTVQTQQQLAVYFSKPRCLAIMETGQNDEWRLWQLIQKQNSLSTLLERSLTLQESMKKIAAMLFIVAEKFVIACKIFTEIEIYLPLHLDNVGLHNNKVVYIGAMPTCQSEKQPMPIKDNLAQGFKETVTAIMNHPDLDATQILNYLKIYASDNPEHYLFIDVFVKLLADHHSI
jgi:hypothetical protein